MRFRRSIGNNTALLESTVKKYNTVIKLTNSAREELDMANVTVGQFSWRRDGRTSQLLNRLFIFSSLSAYGG